jgi:deoxyribonuclease V
MSLQLHLLHTWNLTPLEATQLQRELREKIRIEALPDIIRSVGGVDVGLHGETGRSAVTVFDFTRMELIETAQAEQTLGFPYVPGLLSFREVPVILAALEQLSSLPDVLLVDGQGMAHPRRMGIASHLGLLLDLPSVGCAKSILIGKYGELGLEAGCRAELYDKDEVIGMAVRTRQGCRPVIVSIGHRADLGSAVKLVLACCRGYRLPEPTRIAHQLASRKT